MANDLPVTANSEEPHDDDEFQLQSLPQRPESLFLSNVPQVMSDGHRVVRNAKQSRYQRNPHTSLYAIDSAVLHWVEPLDVPGAMRSGSASPLISPSSGRDDQPVASRNYRAIKSIQKFVRLFSYTTIVVIPLFLSARLVFLICFSGEDLGIKFPAFIGYSFWVAATTVLGSAMLMALTEFFQILLDVQSDTLAESNASASNG